MIVMEAMLRRPTGNLQRFRRIDGRSKVPGSLPVRPSSGSSRCSMENHMPGFVDVRQDIEPWKRALAALLGDR
jgi:hypothetical protein